jgi:hypothetical protein
LSVELWCADLRTAGPALREVERHTPRLSDSEGPVIVTRDLRVGDGFFAALALGPAQMGRVLPEILWLSTSIDGLRKLLA